MGLLDLIFGKKSARTIKQVHKAAGGFGGKTKREQETKSPTVEWRKSEKGNDTTEIEGYRITIFRQDGGWNYCISEILDEEEIADGEEDSPEFGEGYATKGAAKKAALEEVF